jgi:parallel beta-helix repeat protein
MKKITIILTLLLLSACKVEELADRLTGAAVNYANPLSEQTSKASDPDRILPPNPTGCPNWKKDQTIIIEQSRTLPRGCKYDRVSIIVRGSNITFDCNQLVLNGIDREFRQAVDKPYSVENAPLDVGIFIQSSQGNVTVKNCTTRNFVRGIRIGSHGLTSERINNLKNNTNVAQTERELLAISPKNIRVENSNILYSHKDGVFVGRYITDFVLDNSTVKYTGAVGVYLDSGSQHNTIQNSTIAENGHSDYNASKRVRTRKLANDSREGIAIDSSAKNIIKNNVFSKNSGGAIFIYKNCNEHAQNPNQVPRYQSADENLIINNQFNDEGIGIWVASRQSKNLHPLECGSPIVDTGTIRYGPVKEPAKYYEDFAKYNRVEGNSFNNTHKAVIIEDDNNSVVNNTFRGEANFDVRIGTKFRTLKLLHPVTNTLIENNQFLTRTDSHITTIHDPVGTVIKNNTPASVNN